MALTGKAKTDYQREYMRRRRSNNRSNAPQPVRPNDVRPNDVRPKIAARIATVRPSNGTDPDNIRAATERLTAALGGPAIEPEPQSYNPMMVGYVPPEVI